MKKSVISLLLLSSILIGACSQPQPGPDKTLAGAVLGAGWGAGAGAVVGHQLSGTPTGEGVAVGAGLGAASGAMAGMGFDLAESAQIKEERELGALQLQNAANSRQITKLQRRVDNAVITHGAGGLYQVYFDADATNLRTGSIANLENIAESIKTNPAAYVINVVGHSDDAGTPEYNEKIAEARARTVAGYIAARGISLDQIRISSQGSKQPVASNGTPIGRQLNRRVEISISKK